MSLRQQDSDDANAVTTAMILLSGRRHQSQSQSTPQQPQQHQPPRWLSPQYSRTRHASDADVSSDFSSLSEMDLQRDLHSGGDHSDYETPLGGRWDLTAHWHIGDYSEGVEGDADDDDDEERDNDTDLSEGGPAGQSRSIQLDLGRVHEILGSSPGSTPIILSGLSSLTTSRGAGERNSTFDLHSSASEDMDSRRLSHNISTAAASERTVRFSSREPQRVYVSALSTDGDRSPERSILSLEVYALTRDDILPEMGRDDSQGDLDTRHQSNSSTGNSGNGNSNNGGPSSSGITTGTNYVNRLNRATTNSAERRNNPITSLDFENHLHLHSPRVSDSQNTRIPGAPGGGNGAGGHRIHTLQYPPSPSLGRDERRYFSAVTSRHSLSTSPRSHTSPYWSMLSRHQQYSHSSSPISSLSSSPTSSTSSSGMASPIPELHSVVGSTAPEGGDVDQTSIDQQSIDNDDEKESRQTDRHETHKAKPSSATTAQRRVVSSNISSLPSFASSIFTPRTQGRYVRPSGSYKKLRSNHPRRQCCFLQPGQKFIGTQKLKTHMSTLSGLRSRQIEEWDVKVTISAVDYDAGAVYGLMEAIDVPMSASNVVTFWEGEIIDFKNHTLWTKKWSTKPRTDLEHWKRLEAFQGIEADYIVNGAVNGKFRGHIEQKYIFMRWKETHFVNVSEQTSGLTIAGFYYVSMRRSDGYIEGYYHDQQSTPFQHLCLNPIFEARGFSSSIFEVA
ncbi:vacuolar import and degradation protein-domain-containing protein [Dissophora ornata]